MTRLLQEATFDGFGDSFLTESCRDLGPSLVLPTDRLDARKMLREACPLTPGIYGWLDRNGRLIYVGKSKCLRNRLLTYYAKTPADEKMTRIVQHSRTIMWETVGHELLALLREQELISRWRPSLNVQGQPQRRQPAFLCIGGRPAQNAYFSRKVHTRSSQCYGPVAGTKQMRQTAVSLNYAFQLRDCPDKTPMKFMDQLELFPAEETPGCIRHDLASCPAPCAGYCSRNGYEKRVAAAVDFLEGNDTSVLDRLHDQMLSAAKRNAFETAAVLRDQLHDLQWLNRRLEMLRKARYELNCVYAVTSSDGREVWLYLRSGMLRHTSLAPVDLNSSEICRSLLEDTSSSINVEIPQTTHDINIQMILVSWFRKHPVEHAHLISFQKAKQICAASQKQCA